MPGPFEEDENKGANNGKARRQQKGKLRETLQFANKD